MARSKSTELDVPVTLPPAEQWQAPMAWVGPPMTPAPNFPMEFPEKALLVRASAEMTLSKPTGPGMTQQTFQFIPALLRLEKCKPIEVHLTGPDGRCWTYRLNRAGRKSKWVLFVGSSFPATDAAPESHLSPMFVEHVLVQSLQAVYGSHRHVSFMIHDDGRMEDFANAVDPDPDD